MNPFFKGVLIALAAVTPFWLAVGLIVWVIVS